jgi:O-antigen ligase
MPPILALTLALIFSGALLVRESYQQKDVSRAVWIPCLWLMILGSRPISQWLNLGGPVGVEGIMEGSPVDRIIYLILMIAAFGVLLYRKIAWGSLFKSNVWLMVFLGYCLLSVAWSDFPSIAAKRWFKSLGDPLMALILLSEANPPAAVASILRRCAFVLIPLSVVFIKYFPYLGRGYDDWSGLAYYVGVTTNKNLLGYLLLVFGLLFGCTVMTRTGWPDKVTRRSELGVSLVMLAMIAWLIKIANSMTSAVALCAACAIAAALGSKVVRKSFGAVAATTLIVGISLQFMFNITGVVIEAIGRDATLTGRTDIWAAVLTMAQHPLLGAGFQSFWLGDRLTAMWAKFPVFKPNQAHNGYIEIYLNLGWIGIALFVGLVVASYKTMRDRLERAVTAVSTDAAALVLAKFAIGYLAAYLLYNVTEAIFQPLNFLFIVFLVLGMRWPFASEPAVATSVELRPVWTRPEVRKPAVAGVSPRQWRPTPRWEGVHRQHATARVGSPAPWSNAGRAAAQTQDGKASDAGGVVRTGAGNRPSGPAATAWTPPKRNDKSSH